MVVGGARVFALEVESGVGAGLGYTDNAALAHDDEESDWITVGYVGARIAANRGPLRAEANTSLNYQKYIQNTFSDKYYFNLAALAGWEMVRDHLDWQLQNFFTQRPVDNTEPDTPGNTQDTNAFTFGPVVRWPFSGRQSITLSPAYRNFYYEDSNTDNQQYSLTASWFYQMYRLTGVGLDGDVTWVDYDDERRNPNYTISNLRIVVASRRARSDFDLNFGVTHISRDRFESQNGFSGELSWLVRLSGRSRARAYIASELTDANQGLLDASVNPDDGDFSNVQISSDVVRDQVIRFEYLRQDDTLSSRLWGELRDLDYKETPDDRDVQAVGAVLNYPVTALLTTSVSGSYTRTDLTDEDRTDERYEVGGYIGYRLSRKLRSNMGLRYREKTSTREVDEYTELSAFITLVYGFGEVSRPGTGF